MLQFVVDHVMRRSAEGELAWELPPTIDQALVTAGLKAKLGPWTLATVRHRVAVLSTAHRLKHATNPCEQRAIRTVLSRAARAAVKRGERPHKKTAITLAELEAMLATCDDTLEDTRDRALLCFGFASGGRRRSEIAAADLRDLRRKGKKDFDAASLRAACESEDLVGETKERPVAFGVKSFEHSIDRLEDRCSEVLNLVPAFHDRFIQDDADWSASLYPRLQTFLTEAARSHEHLRLALDAPTTLAFAAGAVLDVKSGRDIELEQRTSSREVWRLDTQTPDAEWPRFNPVLVELGQQAPDIAVAVGLTHDIRADVRTYVDSNLPSAGRILNCMLPSGAGPASVRNRAHAALLAHQLAQAVSETRVPGVARTVHLFMAAPNGFFSFLAGQRRALMGRVTLYEFDFGQAQSGSYMPSLTLPLAAAPSAAIALTPR